jgi:hypothetical protein
VNVRALRNYSHAQNFYLNDYPTNIADHTLTG